jgi:hypothetical protein
MNYKVTLLTGTCRRIIQGLRTCFLWKKGVGIERVTIAQFMVPIFRYKICCHKTTTKGSRHCMQSLGKYMALDGSKARQDSGKEN